MGDDIGFGAIRANLNGGSASVAFNPFKYLGLVADFGGYDSTNGGELGGASIFTYLFGPKVAIRTGRFTPFVQFLAGAPTSTLARVRMALLGLPVLA